MSNVVGSGVETNIFIDAVPQKQQKQKEEQQLHIPGLTNPLKQDHRSFVQNLFGTMAFRVFEWLTPANLDAATTTGVHPPENIVCSVLDLSSKNQQAVTNEAEDNISKATSHTTIGHESGFGPLARDNLSSQGSLLDGSMDGLPRSRHPDSHHEEQSTEKAAEIPQKPAVRSTAARAPRQISSSSPIGTASRVPGHLPGQLPVLTSALPQSLSQLSPDIIAALYEYAGGQDDELLYSNIQRSRLPPYQMMYPRTGLFHFDESVRIKSITPRELQPQWKKFVEQSIFYVMSDPIRLLQSLSPSHDYSDGAPRREERNNSLHSSLELLLKLDSPAVLHSLWISGGLLLLGVEKGEEKSYSSKQCIMVPQPATSSSTSLPSLPTSPLTQPPSHASFYSIQGLPLRSRTATPPHHMPFPDAGLLNGQELVDLQVINFQALIAFLSPEPQVEERAKIDMYHSEGLFWPRGKLHEHLSDEYALRLARRLFSSLTTLDEASQSEKVLAILYNNFSYNHRGQRGMSSRSDVTWMAFALVQWAKTIIIRDWDGRPEITSAAIQGALRMLATLHDVDELQCKGGNGKFGRFDTTSYRDDDFRNVSHWCLHSRRPALCCTSTPP